MKSKSSLGTYRFCAGCKASENCCTGKYVDLPVLTPEDTQRISEVTQTSRREFTTETSGTLANMKARSGKCYFYRNGKCSIYGSRPIDCRLFPFDVRENSLGNLVLVWYSSACPKPIDAESYIEHAKSLLPEIQAYITEFAQKESPLLDKCSYKIVGMISTIRDIATGQNVVIVRDNCGSPGKSVRGGGKSSRGE